MYFTLGYHRLAIILDYFSHLQTPNNFKPSRCFSLWRSVFESPAVDQPEALVAIVCTKKAAGEMRQRVVTALCGAPGRARKASLSVNVVNVGRDTRR
jgi:hypothetical protein